MKRFLNRHVHSINWSFVKVDLRHKQNFVQFVPITQIKYFCTSKNIDDDNQTNNKNNDIFKNENFKTKEYKDETVSRNGIYYGELVNNDTIRNGKGRFISETGDKYEGEWNADMHHGYGVMEYANGVRYEGEWKNNKFDGKGKLSNADNSEY